MSAAAKHPGTAQQRAAAQEWLGGFERDLEACNSYIEAMRLRERSSFALGHLHTMFPDLSAQASIAYAAKFKSIGGLF